MAKTREQVLAELNAGLETSATAKTREQVLAELNGGGESPRGRETPGARSIAEQQIAAGDGGDDQLRTVDSNADAEFENAHDLPEMSRKGRGMAATGYANASNVITFGAANKLRDMDSGSPLDAKTRAQLDKDYPGSAATGKGIGYLISGTRGLGKVADTAARGTVNAVAPWLARSAAGRIGAAGAAGALSGGVQGAAVEGDGKTGAELGAAFGAGGQAIGEAAAGASKLLKGDNWIGRFAKAKADGRMAKVDEEAAAGQISKDPAGQFGAAGKARNRILARDEALAAQESAQLASAREPHLGAPADRAAVESGLDASVARLPSSGRPASPAAEGVEAEIASIKERLGPNPTNADILAIRKSYQEAAGFGSPAPTDAQLRAQKVYMALREGVANGPIGAADKQYAQSQLARSRRNDLMLGSEDGVREVKLPDVPEGAAPMRQAARAGDEERMAVRLGRLGDDSVEGARSNARIAELRAQSDPEINAALDELEARKAWMATRVGLPEMPTNLSKAVAFPLRVAQQNARAIGARAGLPALDAAFKAAPAAASRAGSGVPFWLDRKRKEKR